MISEKTNTVTAVIPCYNGAAFIGQAISHLLNQTRPPDELIVVDDGSTDESSEIIAGFTEPHIKVICHERNLGLPTGRNNAMKAASGDILVYVDVDAYAEPDFIEHLLAAYTLEDIAGVSGAGYEVRGDTPPNLWRQKFLPQNHGPDFREDVPFLFGISASFRKSALLEIGGFDPRFTTNGEDVDVCLRLRARGYRLVYTPKAVVYHHRNDTLRSLLAMIDRWWFWGHRAHLKNNIPYFVEHLKITAVMFRYIVRTAWNERAWALMKINFLFLVYALRAILKARIAGPPQ